MTITKTTIAAAVNADLNRSETPTTLARAIRAGLKWVSEQGAYSVLFVKGATAALVATNNTITKPTGLRLLDCIVLNDGTYDGEPLEQTTWDYIKGERANGTNSGEPGKYCERGTLYELDRDCDGSYTAKIDYYQYHPDQDAILFGAEFEEAVNCAVIAAYLDSKGQHSRGQYYWARAEQNLPPDAEDDEPNTVTYRDMG
jgi:hypothetical protein